MARDSVLERAGATPVAADRATPRGTSRFAGRFPTSNRAYFRSARGLKFGSIGIGTHLGSLRPGFDRTARAAIVSAVGLGCNLIATARTYRAGRSEIVVGNAVRELKALNLAERDELIICSKAGYVLKQSARWRQSGSVVDRNILSPAFLASEIPRSLESTGLATIDIYLLHNPELHLPHLGARKFYQMLTRCFEILERHVQDNKVLLYGLACWSGFDPDSRTPIDLSRIVLAARRAAGDGRHHFGAIETPLNWLCRHPVTGAANSLLPTVCRENELALIGASPLLSGRFTRLPSSLRHPVSERLSDAQRSIQFARSLPGVTATLVGMNRRAHVEENLRLRQLPPLRVASVRRLHLALDSVGR